MAGRVPGRRFAEAGFDSGFWGGGMVSGRCAPAAVQGGDDEHGGDREDRKAEDRFGDGLWSMSGCGRTRW